MTQKQLEDLGWEFDGEAPAQYGLRMKDDLTIWKFIVSKEVAENWKTVYDIYSYISNYRYNQGYADGSGSIVYQFRKLLHIDQ